MPLTLPAHAAAVLPLCRVRWLSPAALVVGARHSLDGALAGLTLGCVLTRLRAGTTTPERG